MSKNKQYHQSRHGNAHLNAWEAGYVAGKKDGIRWSEQYMLDTFSIWVHRKFPNWGIEAMRRMVEEQADIAAEFADATDYKYVRKADKATDERGYIRDCLNRELQQTFGKYYQPWEVRYEGLPDKEI